MIVTLLEEMNYKIHNLLTSIFSLDNKRLAISIFLVSTAKNNAGF